MPLTRVLAGASRAPPSAAGTTIAASAWMAEEDALEGAPSVPLAFALAASAGFVDAFGYDTFAHAMFAHLSGDTAAAASHLVRGHVAGALHRLMPVPAFALGIAAGAVVAHALRRRRVERRLAVVLAIEGGALGVFLLVAAVHPPAASAVSWLLGVAMGLQNAAARHVAGIQIRTTFVTGMIVFAVDEFVGAGLEPNRAKRRAGAVHAGIWLTFFCGALLGSLATLRFGAYAVAFPMGAVLVVAVADAVRPRRTAEP